MDLMDMQKISRENGGVKYVLVAINCFSKVAFVVPLKNKTAATTAKAAEEILDKSKTKFKLCHTDRGSEFAGAFATLLKNRGIKHYFTHTEMKAQIVERLIRTLKNNIFKDCAMRQSVRYVDHLNKIVNEYNSRKHSTIKMPPNQVTASNEQRLLNTVYNYNRKIVIPKFPVGTLVRVSKQKQIFDKSYWQNWSQQLYKIRAVNRKHPVTYKLSNFDGTVEIPGTYYELELQETKNSDIYMVEKILKRRGNMVLVRWAGYGPEHDTWEPVSNILEPEK